MKIGIITVYESIGNLGSYLQAYALKSVLEKMGHEVNVIENNSAALTVIKNICKINPKREFLLRFIKAIRFIQSNRRLNIISKKKVYNAEFDCLIYGSDEIWNLDNYYFQNELFWGGYVPEDIPKVAYAVSVGAMNEKNLTLHMNLVDKIYYFKQILVRDDRTQRIISSLVNKDLDFVCDPTCLVSVKELSKPIKKIKDRYIFVYTYGVDQRIESLIVEYARKNRLKIISACFWHPWVDQVIECDPLQFSSLIANSECVFTSTFHGAIFSLLNHKRCCILPIREKVIDVVTRLGKTEYIISEDCTIKDFEKTINTSFKDMEFEDVLNNYRKLSLDLLRGTLECLEA